MVFIAPPAAEWCQSFGVQQRLVSMCSLIIQKEDEVQVKPTLKVVHVGNFVFG